MALPENVKLERESSIKLQKVESQKDESGDIMNLLLGPNYSNINGTMINGM